MNLNSTPSAERTHIGFFGSRNAGKSSLVNVIAGQETSVVSDIAGTTTDPVKKSMELLPLGPVLLIDTPGYDDEGHLGSLRIKKTKQVLEKTDIAILVINAQTGFTASDNELLLLFKKRQLPYLVVYNKIDLCIPSISPEHHPSYLVSARTGSGITKLKEGLADFGNSLVKKTPYLIKDLIQAGDFVILVVPLDKSAPKGRLILPQQQTIRDLLEAGARTVVVPETELAPTLQDLKKKPSLVITDSQIFKQANALVPAEIPLTSFSILMARYKGILADAVCGAAEIERLQDHDTILIAEGCTHHRQCEDIGTVKLPKWLKTYTGKNLNFTFTSGNEFPENLSSYRLIIHCGGCMLNEREMRYRMKRASEAGVPLTNYGTAIAYLNGILKRSLDFFPDMQKLLTNSEEKL